MRTRIDDPDVPGSASEREAPFRIERVAYESTRRLRAELGCSDVVAAILARRGLTEAREATRFLAADERHDPGLFEGMQSAVAAIRDAIAAGVSITVHGDYDVDGVCSTSILVAALRELGASCDWLIPDRSQGYGLGDETLAEIAARGSGMIITVDCGITAVEQIATASAAGIEVVVTDHHRPGASLPDCPVVHPGLGGYPFAELCGTAVASKLVEALCGEERADQDLDLVALATVADMMPLIGENRRLVRAGLDLMRARPRTGLAALIEVAGCLPETISESDLGFRLAPRINAAGRLYRADAGVELMLSADRPRANQIAAELQSANHERREVESLVLAEAERSWREQLAESEAGAEPAAIVVAGEGWHPGVLGICASRLAERHQLPAIVLTVEDGRARGSGRSVPGFDLLAAITECGALLDRFGGHRAAAGLELPVDAIPRLREGFCAAVARELPDGPEPARQRVDAIVSCDRLDLDLAEEIRSLGPFGKGNPEPELLIPAARITDASPMGDSGRHSRFTFAGSGARAAGVAFSDDGRVERMAADAAAADLVIRLEINAWNGSVSPRCVLSDARSSREPARVPGLAEPSQQEYLERLTAALWAAPTTHSGGAVDAADPAAASEPERVRGAVGHSGAHGLALIAELAAGPSPVLVICADAVRRRALVEAVLPSPRFGFATAIVASRMSVAGGIRAAGRVLEAGRGVVLCDWPALGMAPMLAAAFEHVVIVDPAWSSRDLAVAAAPCELVRTGDVSPDGLLHVVADSAGPELSTGALDREFPDRERLGVVYRRLREAAAGARLLDPANAAEALMGLGAAAPTPEAAGRSLRVLTEIGALRLETGAAPGRLRVVSSNVKDLSQSAAFEQYGVARQEGHRFLTAARQAMAA